MTDSAARVAGLHLVTDSALCGPRGVLAVVEAAVRGGVRVVQLREKTLPTRAFVERARALKALLAPRGVPLIVNDRLDVALASGADGVHLGQDDLSPEDVRRWLPHALVGLSIERAEQLAEAERLPVDYYGASPVFATTTKTDTAAAHVRQHVLEPLLQRVQVGRIGAAVDLQVHHRLMTRVSIGRVGHAQQASIAVADQLQHRMNDQVQHQPLAVDLHRHGVDEERHVIADDLDHRVRAFPAIFVEPGVEHAHRTGRAAAGDEVPLAQNRAVEIGHRQQFEIVRIDLRKEAHRKLGDGPGFVRRQPRSDLLDHRVDLHGQPVLFPFLHLAPLQLIRTRQGARHTPTVGVSENPCRVAVEQDSRLGAQAQ